MNSSEEDKIIHLDNIKDVMRKEHYIIHSVGDEKTSHKGNQGGSVIVVGSKESSPMKSGAGFFIVLTERMGVSPLSGIKIKYWQADLLDPIKGWEKTQGGSIEENIQLQRQQYNERFGTHQLAPELTNVECSPMAIGKAIRFVSIED